ncbi:MAG: S1 RNA-binding domain-containing protein [Chloroflexota bacterium]|nr:S1 RNA-binding domain-containing protein [Chloroflexota bacterium]
MDRGTNVGDNSWERPLANGCWEALLRGEEVEASPVGEEEVWQDIGSSLGEEEHAGRLEAGEEWRRQAWRLACESFKNSDVLDLEVTDYNRGGLLVTLNGLPGFVPASQLVDMPSYSTSEDRMKWLTSQVGEELPLKIIELDRDQNRLILSERAAVEGEKAERLLNELCEGDIRRGRVTRLCNFGAFIDLGGMEGLIHISELSWGHVDRSSDVLKSGDEVEVYVLNVDRRRQRVGLSLKRLQPNPWDTVEERYQVSQLVQGVVTNVVSFGAFVRIEEGLEGLVHISELAEGNFLDPHNVVKEGDEITVRILSVDGERHRLGLSLRQA